MNAESPFIVLSSDRASNSAELNAAERDLFERQLRARNLDFKQVDGVYKGTRETSYVVLTPTTGDEQNAISLARRYGQESVLLVDANRYATLVFLNPGQGGPHIKELKGVGHWRATDRTEAETQDSYTQDGEAYYVTRALA